MKSKEMDQLERRFGHMAVQLATSMDIRLHRRFRMESGFTSSSRLHCNLTGAAIFFDIIEASAT